MQGLAFTRIRGGAAGHRVVEFSGDVRLELLCPWRIIADGRVAFGSGDRGRWRRDRDIKRIMSDRDAQLLLVGKRITRAQLTQECADLVIEFEGNWRLEIYNNSSIYESWQLVGPPGTIIGIGGGRVASFPERREELLWKQERLNDVIRTHRPVAESKGGELCFRPEDAFRFVADVAATGILILRVRIWFRVGDQLGEDLGGLDLGALCCQEHAVSLCVAEAKDFIKNRLPGHIERVSFDMDDPDFFALRTTTAGAVVSNPFGGVE